MSTDVYVDRGDADDWDFTTVDFITDYNWHELDLSNIVPEGVKTVLLCVLIRDDAINSYIEFRKKGNLYAINRFLTQTQTANIWIADEGIVSCDVNRKIEYQTSNTTFGVINLIVKGWFEDRLGMLG